MTTLPEPTPTATAAGQATNPLTDAVIRAAVDNLVHEARRESTSPPPGREVPAMSARTTEVSRAVMYCSLATVPPGLVATAILLASDHADPTVIGMICAVPAALAVPILALARLLRGAKPQPEVHHHYEGTVYQDQRNVHSNTRGVWAKNINRQ
ncbi:hypothetical protein ACF1AL_14815 [Streptomyces sp. NPDC014801]|uniref:hypothetical protein n=1 Tax=Streptomyces sp. NPDC014801 TaxID=3364916 RepID=UPI0036F897E9